MHVLPYFGMRKSNVPSSKGGTSAVARRRENVAAPPFRAAAWCADMQAVTPERKTRRCVIHWWPKSVIALTAGLA